MIELLASLLLPALTPVLADGARAVFNRITGGTGVHPANVDEAVKLMTAQAEYAKAMAQLDAPPPNISKWVADLRASFRYLAAGAVILGAYGILYLQPILGLSDQVVLEALWARNSAFGFIFGDRMYAYFRRGK